jgi:hypothetical protein
LLKGGLRPKRLNQRHCGKSLTSLKKGFIPLKMYLKSLEILEKASIFLKKSSKIIEISIKASRF